MDAFRSLFRTMGARRRRQLVLTFLVMLAGAVAELVTIGAALPFLSLLTNQPGGGPLAGLPRTLGFGSGSPILLASLLLVVAAIATAAVRLLLLWLSQRFVLGLGHDVATAIFARMLRQPYAEYVRRNSSEVLAGMEKVRDIASSILQPAMQGLIAVVIAACIIALLLSINPFAASLAAVSVTGVYLGISLLTRGRLRRNSKVMAQTVTARTKIVQEGLGGIRDIILDQSQPLFEEKFRRIDRRFREALSMNVFMASAPRFLIESAGIAAIALIALAMSTQPGGIVKAIPVLGALALGAQRLLPLLQQAYNGWSLTSGNLQALADVAALLQTPLAGTKPRPEEVTSFRQEIVFDGVSFSYGSGHFALRDVNLVIAKGARIGVVGTTGSGKSTLLDLLMGLLEPSAGEIRIDGQPLRDENRANWQAQLAHVPQSIYLMDESIASNIAFGAAPGAIDEERLRAVTRAARLEAFIDSLPDGYRTEVGERGIRLSGGQRQRIGIARALYKGAPVLILDEATSALDDETEAEVIRSIMDLGEEITLIMIAHRRTTLAGCDRIVRVERGQVSEAGAGGKAAARSARGGSGGGLPTDPPGLR